MASAGGKVITVRGDRELIAQLNALPKNVRNKILRTRLRAGAKITQTRAKQLAPVDADRNHGAPPGTLRNSIKVRAMKRSRTALGYMVGTGEKDYQGVAFYGAFVEYGHRLGARSKGVKDLGRKASKVGGTAAAELRAQATAIDTRNEVPPHPYLRPAFEETKDQVVEEVRAGLRADLARIARETTSSGD